MLQDRDRHDDIEGVIRKRQALGRGLDQDDAGGPDVLRSAIEHSDAAIYSNDDRRHVGLLDSLTGIRMSWRPASQPARDPTDAAAEVHDSPTEEWWHRRSQGEAL